MTAHTAAVSPRRQAFAGGVGNVLEWYDFAVYGFLAPVMAPLFFPQEDTLSGLINTYGIFAAGYLMRPIGGIIFGHIGDRLGRKKALQLSIAMMAIPTVLVGLLPVHAQAGAAWWAAGRSVAAWPASCWARWWPAWSPAWWVRRP